MARQMQLRDFNDVRGYIRDFYVFAYKNQADFADTTISTYYNKLKQIKFWLGDYFVSRKGDRGVVSYFSFDNRKLRHNPLYYPYKCKNFTDVAMKTHFAILSALSGGGKKSTEEIYDELYYLGSAESEDVDINLESVRNRIKEYVQIGILKESKRGSTFYYELKRNSIDINRWKRAIEFFSEVDPLGLIGSFILERFEDEGPGFFCFKHGFSFQAIDSIVLFDIVDAIEREMTVKITESHNRTGNIEKEILPLKVYISTDSGRQHVLAYDMKEKQYEFHRIDYIDSVEIRERNESFANIKSGMSGFEGKLWNPTFGQRVPQKYSIEFDFPENAEFLVRRLTRESRNGTVKKKKGNWILTVEAYDTTSVLPLIRSFMGYIVDIKSLDSSLKEIWQDELALYEETYGI